MISKPLNIDKNLYYVQYIQNALGNDLIDSLKISRDNTIELFSSIPENHSEYRYGKNKWTIKRVLKHIPDSERILSYRALRIARNDKTDLPGYNENFYAENDNTENLSLKEIKEEFITVRNSTIELFKTLNDKVLDSEGTVNGLTFSPRVIGWIISGHNTHHCEVIKDKYLYNIPLTKNKQH